MCLNNHSKWRIKSCLHMASQLSSNALQSSKVLEYQRRTGKSQCYENNIILKKGYCDCLVPHFVIKTKEWLIDLPALLIRMLTDCSSCQHLWANRWIDSLSARSNSLNTTSAWIFPDLCLISLSAFVALSSFRQAKMTRAPRRTKSTAVSLPIPELLPAMDWC